jgi:hypothetical protein
VTWARNFPPGCNEFIVGASPDPPIFLGNGGEENRCEGAPAIGVGAALHLDQDIGQFLGKGRLGFLVETAVGVMYLDDWHCQHSLLYGRTSAASVMAMFGLPRPDLVIVDHQSFDQQHVCGIRGDLELDTLRTPDPQAIAASQ